MKEDQMRKINETSQIIEKHKNLKIILFILTFGSLIVIAIYFAQLLLYSF